MLKFVRWSMFLLSMGVLLGCGSITRVPSADSGVDRASLDQGLPDQNSLDQGPSIDGQFVDSERDSTSDGPLATDRSIPDQSESCNQPRMMCQGMCVDPQISNEHCGTCDNPCLGGCTCTLGVCVLNNQICDPV